MKFYILTISIGLLFILGLAFYFNSTERVESFFPEHVSELYQGDWVPKVFPEDIHHIHLTYFVDSHQTWLRFEKGKKDFDLSDLKRLSQTQKQSLKIKRPSQVSWWFEGLIEQQPANDAALYAEVYEGQDGPYKTYLAIPQSGKFYYWWRD